MGQPKLIEEDDFDSVFSDELEAGHTLMHGQYTIESFLNAGGFGITYRAKDSLNRAVVIKECFPGSFCRRTTTSVQARSRAHQRELSSIVRLFVEEARSLAKLDHPNIVGVHQVFEENNTAYMALDFVEGRDLLDVIEKPEDVLEPEQIEKILRKMLDAVGFIHDQGVLHRDISPDNILLQPNMEPILIDFGAAREEAGKQSRILSALRVVKDGYSPQEFYISGATQGQFSDLYALGATFYHLITGELPANSQARLAAVAAGEPDPYIAVIDRMPAYSEQFLFGIDKALEILPKDRIENAQQWLGLLDGTVKMSAVATSAKKAKKTTAKTATAGGGSSKGKTRLLAGAAILIPVIGGAVMMQSGALDSSSAPTLDVAPAAPDVSALAATVGVTPIAAPVTAPQTTTPDTAATASVDVSDQDMVALFSTPSASPTVDIAPVAAQPPLPTPVPAAVDTTPDIAPDVEAVLVVDVVPVIEPVAPVANLNIPSVVAPVDAPIGTSDIAQTIAAAVQQPVGPPLVSSRPNLRPSPIAVNQAPAGTPETVIADPVETVEPVATDAAVEITPTPPVSEPVPDVAPVSPPAAVAIAEPVTPAAPALSWLSTAQNTPIPQLSEQPVTESDLVTTQTVTELYDLPQVVTGWSVDVAGALPAETDKLFAVNGLPIDDVSRLDTLLHRTFGAPDGATMDLAVLAGRSPDSAAIANITVPVVHKTLLLNGTMFETRMFGTAWNTIVVAAPAGGDFQAGDMLIGDLGTGSVFDARTSLPDVLAQANTDSRERLILAVRRDGNVVTIEIPAPR